MAAAAVSSAHQRNAAIQTHGSVIGSKQLGTLLRQALCCVASSAQGLRTSGRRSPVELRQHPLLVRSSDRSDVTTQAGESGTAHGCEALALCFHCGSSMCHSHYGRDRSPTATQASKAIAASFSATHADVTACTACHVLCPVELRPPAMSTKIAGNSKWLHRELLAVICIADSMQSNLARQLFNLHR